MMDLQSKINAVGARVKMMEDRYGVAAAPAQPTQTKPAQEEEDDGDVDLFGSDSDEDEAASEAREKLLEAYAAKKAKSMDDFLSDFANNFEKKKCTPRTQSSIATQHFSHNFFYCAHFFKNCSIQKPFGKTSH